MALGIIPPRLAILSLCPVAWLCHFQDVIDSHIAQQLARARWPADLDFANHGRVAQAEMNAWDTGPGISRTGCCLVVELSAVVRSNTNLRANAHTIAFRAGQLQHEPMIGGR